MSNEIQKIIDRPKLNDQVVVEAQVVLEYARPNPKKGTIDVLLHTTYTLDRMKRLAEATMNADGAHMVLVFRPRQPELFDKDEGDDGEPELVVTAKQFG